MMLEILICVAVLIIDQLSKLAAVSYLSVLPNGQLPVIEGVFSLTYLENRGAAFGMLQNAQTFFIIATLVLTGAMIYFMVKERPRIHTLMRVSMALILAGAIGNFIDRVFLGYVRDMLDFCLINFPVFNVADSAITVGAAILFLDILFFKGKKLFSEDGGKAAEPEKTERAEQTAKTDEPDASGSK